MYDVKVYSLKAEGSRQITEHFRVYEFACSDGSRPGLCEPDPGGHPGKHPGCISASRSISTAATRTVSYNAQNRGQQPQEPALQRPWPPISGVEGHTPAEVYAYAETLLGNHGGLGIYNTFVHIDVRADKSRWDYRAA